MTTPASQHGQGSPQGETPQGPQQRPAGDRRQARTARPLWRTTPPSDAITWKEARTQGLQSFLSMARCPKDGTWQRTTAGRLCCACEALKAARTAADQPRREAEALEAQKARRKAAAQKAARTRKRNAEGAAREAAREAARKAREAARDEARKARATAKRAAAREAAKEARRALEQGFISAGTQKACPGLGMVVSSATAPPPAAGVPAWAPGRHPDGDHAGATPPWAEAEGDPAGSAADWDLRASLCGCGCGDPFGDPSADGLGPPW
jgi:hypothetical protein